MIFGGQHLSACSGGLYLSRKARARTQADEERELEPVQLWVVLVEEESDGRNS